MFELYANYYTYHRQNEIYTSVEIINVEQAKELAVSLLAKFKHYKSIAIVLNNSTVETVTR